MSLRPSAPSCFCLNLWKGERRRFKTHRNPVFRLILSTYSLMFVCIYIHKHTQIQLFCILIYLIYYNNTQKHRFQIYHQSRSLYTPTHLHHIVHILKEQGNTAMEVWELCSENFYISKKY